ncbi:MAG: hypothetical protein ACYS0G_01975, partial [Planctomycetota bacterium]
NDVLAVADYAVVAGTLDIALIDGFIPELGQEFTIVTSTGTVTGEFDAVTGDGQYAVTYNETSIVITVLALPCLGDLDGSGSVGIADLLALLAAWGTDPGGPPDFNGDGTVGISDLLALLANWGPCA